MGGDVFFLASREGQLFKTPALCQVLGTMRDVQRDDLLLVAVNPPLVIEGQYLQISGRRSFSHLLLAPRHFVGEWPSNKNQVDVYVLGLRSLTLPALDHQLDPTEYWNLAWATTFESAKEAQAAMAAT